MTLPTGLCATGDGATGDTDRGPWSTLVSRRRLMASTAAAAAGALLSIGGCSTAAAGGLVCRHQRTHDVYAELEVSVGSMISHSWIHSIELSRWTDTFEVTPDGLMLVTAEFSAYGAGMPLDEGEVTVRDGVVVVEEIHREFEAIRWIHSHRADYRIGIDGDESLINPGDLPDNEPLELRPQ